MKSKSFKIAKDFLGKIVQVTVDRPIGSKHPKWGFVYEINYGYVEGIKASDGEELDAYILKISMPVKKYTGQVIAIIHRLEDDDDKLVVVSKGENMTNQEINKAVKFQEKWFKIKIIRSL